MLPPAVFAAGEFETVFHSTYEIDEKANTIVTHRVELTNLSANIYASEYSVTVGNTNIGSPRAFDDSGQLKLEINPGNNTTELTVILDQKPTVGLGKTKKFFIQYQSADIAVGIGRILEVNAPKTANSNEFRDYSITITVPKKFGGPSRIIPDHTLLRETNEKTIVLFNKEALKSGVTAVFGTKQSFLLNLTYYLENKSSTKVKKTVALVPDTSRQKVEYLKILPKPKNIEADKDGNWLANYELAAGEELAITAELVAEVNLDMATPAPTGNPNDYLSGNEYWQTDDPVIAALAEKLKTPKEIYDFVVKTLSYDYSRAENGGARRGAIEALNNPAESICTEFTDLFIALARSAGIPAREKAGFAYTTNLKLRPLSLKKDILHAWPEYWDNQSRQWVEIDPTWSNTTGGIDYFSKMDLAHITFVIHGISTIQPPPAGFYKTKKTQNKTIEITPIESSAATIPKIEISAYVPEMLSNWKKNKIKLEVSNKSGTAGYELPLFADNAYTMKQESRRDSSAASRNDVIFTDVIETILPWQTFTKTIELKPPGGWQTTKGNLKISAGGVTKIYETNWGPPISKPAAIVSIGGLLTAGTAAWIRRLCILRKNNT